MKNRTAFVNGKVFTGLKTETEAVFVEGNTIVDLGTTSEILDLVGDVGTSSVRIVDFQGKTVIPGFIDSHNHVLAAADLLEGVNCFGLTSIEEVKQEVARKAKEKEEGEWIVGAG